MNKISPADRSKGTDPTFESDRYTIESEIDEPEGIVQLEVCDTAGTHDVDGLRKKAYADCHVVVIAFDMNSQDSLDNVGHKVRFALTEGHSFLRMNSGLARLPSLRRTPKSFSSAVEKIS